MNSPKYLNYETRPIKFVERKMLLASLLKICNYFGDYYQYIGFGGLSFVDFKLFHKELHINNLISIEGGSFTNEKISFNSPFSFVKIIMDGSTNALSKIDLTNKSLVWLDYDGTLDSYMFSDIEMLFSKLPIGSIFLVTCNRELKDSESQTEYTKDQFINKFETLIPFEVENKDFSSIENYKTIRKMFTSLINTTLKERSKVENVNFKFVQLFNILYKENRGANMYTFGGIIADHNFDKSELNLTNLNFISVGEIPYQLEIPNLTMKEIDLINKYFDEKEELMKLKIISLADYTKYKETYKYLPNFLDVRI